TFLVGVIHGNGSGLTGLTGASLVANSVTNATIASGAVTTLKIAAAAVTTQQIADSAVTTNIISNGSVTPEKLAFTPGGVPNGMKEYLTSETWVAPPGIIRIMVEAWGAGGGAGYSVGTRFPNITPAGNGGYSRTVLPVTP